MEIFDYSSDALALHGIKEQEGEPLKLYDVVCELYGFDEQIEAILKGKEKRFTLEYVYKEEQKSYINIHVCGGKASSRHKKSPYQYETFLVLFEYVTTIAKMHQEAIQNQNEKSLLLETISEKNRQLNAYNEHMQELVAQEMRKNLEKQKMVELQARHSQMGEMIGMITHQWKQPLNVISIITSVLKQKLTTGNYTKEIIENKLDEINKQIQFMSRTIKDFQNFFNPSSQKRAFYLWESLEMAIELVKYEYEYHNITIKLSGNKNIEAVGYPNEFSQVVLSLLKNSKDAFLKTPKSHMLIEITLEENDNEAIVYIQDNAGGIPNDIIDKIFDLYMTTKKEGSGLGLNIAKNIIENNMQGSLRVKNSQDGALFSIHLP